MTRVMTVVTKVKQYWAEHPDSDDVKACMKATGASRNTAKKYKPKKTDDSPGKPAAAGGHDFQATYPKGHRDARQQETAPPGGDGRGDASQGDAGGHGDKPAGTRVESWRLRL